MTMASTPTDALQDVATGQRMLIFAIVVNVAAYILSNAVDPIVGLAVGIVGLVLGVTGMVRTTRGLGFSTPRKVFYVIGLFIPLISLFVLVSASARATKMLRANGYKVGFFGAKQ